MAKFSKKQGGKEVGQADFYAPPHTEMPNQKVNRSYANTVNMTVGNIDRHEPAGTKTTGIVTRGNGCATKGITARGPMA
jgi:hypothetical protein